MPAPLYLRVFISSPGDVADERNLARRLLKEAVNRFGCRPSECDIVIVVLWSRLGTQLKIDGTSYLSGTEYEEGTARNFFGRRP